MVTKAKLGNFTNEPDIFKNNSQTYTVASGSAVRNLESILMVTKAKLGNFTNDKRKAEKFATYLKC